jgi:hypothetical protein
MVRRLGWEFNDPAEPGGNSLVAVAACESAARAVV